MTKWIIFYDDGTEFSDKDGEPWRSPDKGIVCIAQFKDDITIHKFDWYYYRTDHNEWWGGDSDGLKYQLRKYAYYINTVRIGVMVTNKFYQECMSRAFETRTK